ncbi:hypothetical protein K431DRAFT_288753, partial [Polychaeton citri CBS 116435]
MAWGGFFLVGRVSSSFCFPSLCWIRKHTACLSVCIIRPLPKQTQPTLAHIHISSRRWHAGMVASDSRAASSTRKPGARLAHLTAINSTQAQPGERIITNTAYCVWWSDTGY